MSDTEKIIRILEGMQQDIRSLRDGQKSLHGTVDQHGKILAGLAATVGTMLEEQQAQRLDIRSLHEELHATKEELKSEILSARAEAKRTATDLQAALGRTLKGHERRIDGLEDEAGIPHPDEN